VISLKKTDLDVEFVALLKEFESKLLDMNKKAFVRDEDNIKSNTCYLCEIIDTMLE